MDELESFLLTEDEIRDQENKDFRPAGESWRRFPS